MTPAGLTFLERVRGVGPLGVRFWDAVTGAVVGAGLVVEVYPKAEPTRRFKAVVSGSGVFSVRGLPGLGTYETGGAAPVPPKPFVVEVTDPGGRFVPFAMPVDVPAGLLQWQAPGPAAALYALEPDAGAPMVPLFSAPGRPVPTGMAVVRAQLVRADRPAPTDPVKQVPAAWAVLELTLPDGARVRGLADERGRVAVVFPYPEVPDAVVDPPPAPGDPDPPPPTPVRAGDRTWTVRAKVYFAPTDPVPARPDLTTALGQPAARVQRTEGTATEALQEELRFGADLILGTRPAADPDNRFAELFITQP